MALRSSLNQRVGFSSKQTRTARVVVRAVQTAEKAKAAASPVDDVQFINPLWSQPSTEKEFLGLIAKLVEAGKCPKQLQAGWVDFYQLYRKTIESSGVADAEKVATKVQATIADTVFNQVRVLALKSIKWVYNLGLELCWACMRACARFAGTRSSSNSSSVTNCWFQSELGPIHTPSAAVHRMIGRIALLLHQGPVADVRALCHIDCVGAVRRWTSSQMQEPRRCPTCSGQKSFSYALSQYPGLVSRNWSWQQQQQQQQQQHQQLQRQQGPLAVQNALP
jgi:hypothetical protein